MHALMKLGVTEILHAVTTKCKYLRRCLQTTRLHYFVPTGTAGFKQLVT